MIAAFALAGPEGKVFVVDTENNSASLYADEFPPYATFNMTPEMGYTPRNFINAIEAAERAGADVIILDSASHEWMGEGGALDMVDLEASKSKSKNTYNAWRPVTPEHRDFIEKIIRSKCHIIATFRSKVEYEKNGSGGYDKIGLQAITRDGVDYEFTVWCEMDTSHRLVVTKTRCAPLTDKIMMKPDEKFFGILKDWLAGASAEELGKTVYKETVKKEAPKTLDILVEEAKQYGLNSQGEVFAYLKEQGFTSFKAPEYPLYVKAFQARA